MQTDELGLLSSVAMTFAMSCISNQTLWPSIEKYFLV